MTNPNPEDEPVRQAGAVPQYYPLSQLHLSPSVPIFNPKKEYDKIGNCPAGPPEKNTGCKLF